MGGETGKLIAALEQVEQCQQIELGQEFAAGYVKLLQETVR
jgi:hypothetical protein